MNKATRSVWSVRSVPVFQEEVPLNWNNWIRQVHRWLSIAFTVTVIANFVVLAKGGGTSWVTYSPLLPLALLLFTGLYLFVLPYATRWRSGRRTRLTLWHNIDRGFISMGAAGWHICFDVLDRFLAGQPTGRIVGSDAMKVGGWQRLNAEYSRQFGVAPKR